MRLYNWNRTVSSNPGRIFYPRTVQSILQIVMRAKTEGKKLRTVGDSRYTFSDISSSDDNQWIINTKYLDRVLSIDESTVTVQPGVTLHQLNKYLAGHEYALRNLGAVDKQTIGGLISTATHGSNRVNSSSSTFSDLVTKMVVIDGEGRVRKVKKGDNYFSSLICSFGYLGIITEITLEIVPAFNVRQEGEMSTLDDIKGRLDRLMEDCDSIELISLEPYDSIILWKRYNEEYDNSPLRNAIKILSDDFNGHLREIGTRLGLVLPSIKPYLIRMAEGVIGRRKPLSLRSDIMLINNDLFGTYNASTQLNQELCFPYANFLEAFKMIKEILLRHSSSVSTSIGVRFESGSNALLSPSNSRNTVYFDFSFQTVDRTKVEPLVLELENEALKLQGRPHYGKMNFLDYNKMKSLYPEENISKFMKTKEEYDPSNLFSLSAIDKLFS